MIEPYYYVRFRWGKDININEVSKDLSLSFSVELNTHPRDSLGHMIGLGGDELKVTADTLTARMSRFRAVLYQKKAAPFTIRDIELRNKVLELFPHNRSSPFPWSLTHEPKFEMAK